MRIPPEIWRLCHRELQLYPLRKARLEDRRTEVFEAGGDKSCSDMPHGTGTSSPIDAKMQLLLSFDVLEDESRIKAVEDVLAGLTPLQRRFHDLHYKQGHGIVACGRVIGYGDRSINKIKYEIIERTAVRLGYIR